VTDGEAAPPPDRIPLVIGVTGHRDLRDADLARLEHEIAGIFDALQRNYLGGEGTTPIILLSMLAEGADQLVARIALDRGLWLIAPLPMPRAEFRRDFVERPIKPDAVAVFDALLARAIAAPEMPLAQGSSRDDIATFGPKRDLQYREANLFIARHCHVLIALWNGDECDAGVGGTAEMIGYKRHGIPLHVSASARAGIDCIECGPVIHVVTNRSNSNSAPRTSGVRSWVGNARGAPRSHVARRALHVFAEFIFLLFGFSASRGSAKLSATEARERDAWADFEDLTSLTRRFNEESSRLAFSRLGPALIKESLSTAFQEPSGKGCNDAARDCGSVTAPRWCAVFSISDTLANQWQRRFLAYSKTLFWLGFIGFACFASAAHVVPTRTSMLLVYSISIVCLFAVLLHSRKRQLQERFLDYRALAEALRITIFWMLVGIGERSGAIGTAYPATQPHELGWVKRALRALDLLEAVDAPTRRPGVLNAQTHDWLRRLWVGGQRCHFEERARTYRIAGERSEARCVALLLLAPLLALVVVGADFGLINHTLTYEMSIDIRESLILTAGILTGLAAVTAGLSRQLWLEARARQCDRMNALFKRVDELMPERIDAESTQRLRDLYRELGVEAMNEHAAWRAIHRRRRLRLPHG
jgi:hypothetical protein